MARGKKTILELMIDGPAVGATNKGVTDVLRLFKHQLLFQVCDKIKTTAVCKS
jgi:hypothetical protein